MGLNVRYLFLHVCVYVPFVKLYLVPVNCKQGFCNPDPLHPLYLLSLHPSLLSLLLLLLTLTLQPFLRFFPQSPPSFYSDSPLVSLQPPMQSPVFAQLFLSCSRIFLSPHFSLLTSFPLQQATLVPWGIRHYLQIQNGAGFKFNYATFISLFVFKLTKT